MLTTRTIAVTTKARNRALATLKVLILIMQAPYTSAAISEGACRRFEGPAPWQTQHPREDGSCPHRQSRRSGLGFPETAPGYPARVLGCCHSGNTAPGRSLGNMELPLPNTPAAWVDRRASPVHQA